MQRGPELSKLDIPGKPVYSALFQIDALSVQDNANPTEACVG